MGLKMRRLVYMAAEWGVVYLFTLGIGIIFLYFSGIFDKGLALLPALLLIMWAIVSIPLSLRVVAFGPGRMSLAWGFYQPVRPIATAAQAGLFKREAGDRTSIRIDYRDPEGRDPFDIVRLLSAHLETQGIAHTNLGHISVTDGAARWRVEPGLDGNRIEAWVEANDPEDREQILAGLEAFLTGPLSLNLSWSEQ